MMKKSEKQGFAALRRKASEAIRNKTRKLRKIAPLDTQSLVHELETHQIELEMQNEELRRAGQDLEDSQRRYADLYDFAPVGYFVLDCNGVILSVNFTGARMVGRDKQKVAGAPFSSFVVKEEWESFFEHLRHVFRTSVKQIQELRMLLPDKSVLHAQLQSIMVEEKEGQPARCRTAVIDVTDRKRAEEAVRESEKKYRNLFNSMNEGFALHELILDADGKPYNYRFLEANDAFETLTGLTRERVLGKTIRQVLPDIEPYWIRAYGDVVLTGRPAQFENYSSSLGKWYMVYSYPSGKNRFATLFFDITERKRSEEAILKLNKEMTARNAELEALNKEMESFVYSISHDLRAPVRSMAGFSNIMMENYASKIDKQGKDYLSRIQAGSQKMAGLIEDLLKLSGVTRQDIDRIETDLSAQAETIIANLRESEPGRTVEVAIQPGIKASADSQLIQIVLTNLLENAWKFTSKIERARIEFGAFECGARNTEFGAKIKKPCEQGQTVYYARDNGAGFNPEYVGKMFRPFQRLHSDEEFIGTGIGLAIVERVISRHGGKVWAEGEIGKGATVYFTLGNP